MATLLPAFRATPGMGPPLLPQPDGTGVDALVAPKGLNLRTALVKLASASQGCVAVQHYQQGIVIVHEKPFIAPTGPIPGLPILAHAIAAMALKGSLRKGLEHREKHLIRLFNPA